MDDLQVFAFGSMYLLCQNEGTVTTMHLTIKSTDFLPNQVKFINVPLFEGSIYVVCSQPSSIFYQ